MPRQNVNDLLVFLAVARERSFTKAAAQLGVSQSAVSHTIRRLEERLGVRLLTRTTRSVAPTDAGGRLLRMLGRGLTRSTPNSRTQRSSGEARRHHSAHRRRIRDELRLAPNLRPPAGLSGRQSGDHGRQRPHRHRDGAFRRGGSSRRAGREGHGRRAHWTRPAHGRGRRAVVLREAAATAEAPGLAHHDCINLRMPTLGAFYAWEFEKAGRELSVRVEGQLAFNNTRFCLNASLAGFGLAYVPEDRRRVTSPTVGSSGCLGLVRAFFRLSPLLPEPPATHARVRIAR